MKPIEHILFPVDLVRTSEKIIPYVTETALRFGSTLDILYVVRMLKYFNSIDIPHPTIEFFECELIEGGYKKMKEFSTRHFSSMPNVFKEVLLGDPAETILDYIDANHIDMVVMGSQDRNEPGRVMFGSVAERVIKNSPVPVLVINPEKTV
jgi:nucleotide-binding universal stress UspA family protein